MKGSAQYSYGDDIAVLSVTIGPGRGGSVSQFNTSTVSTSTDNDN